MAQARSTYPVLRMIKLGSAITEFPSYGRLYVLRNQLVHGGATWASRVNRAQVRDGAAILDVIVPQILSIMLDHPEHDFSEVLYPVV